MYQGPCINCKTLPFPGRIHSAIVSGVNLETRSVTVEWYERGETKGKEVEIDAILALNPELAVGPRHHTPHLQPMPNKLARVRHLSLCIQKQIYISGHSCFRQACMFSKHFIQLVLVTLLVTSLRKSCAPSTLLQKVQLETFIFSSSVIDVIN